MSESTWRLVELGHGSERSTYRTFAPDEEAARMAAYGLWAEPRLPYPQQVTEVRVLHESELAPEIQTFLRGLGETARKTTLLYTSIDTKTAVGLSVSDAGFAHPEPETDRNTDQIGLLAPQPTDLSDELVSSY